MFLIHTDHQIYQNNLFHWVVVYKNFYFDSVNFNNYYDNLDGNIFRTKIRIRWYGDLFGYIENPVLELKIKNGLLGNKISYNLIPYKFNTDWYQI